LDERFFSALVSAQRSTAIFAFPDDDRTARLLDGSLTVVLLGDGERSALYRYSPLDGDATK
jgi:hypothetical protein